MSFRTETTGAVMTQADFFEGASTQQAGWGEAAGLSFVDSMLSSFGLGTAIRETAIPAGAPTDPLPDAPMEVPRIAPQEVLAPPTFGSPAPGVGDVAPVARIPTGPFVQPESPTEFAQRRAAAKPLSEDEYKASPSFRAKIPWDRRMNEDRASALASWYDAKQYRQTLMERTDTFAVQTIAGLLGQATDPINFVPILGPAARAIATTRFGVIAGRAAVGSADAALNTAIFGAATAPLREQYGDDVSFSAMLLDIGSAAIIGAAFGGVGGFFEKRGLDRQSAAIRNVQDIQRTMEEAVSSLVMDGQVRMSDPALGAIERMRQGEAQAAMRRMNLDMRSSTALDRFLSSEESGIDLPSTFEDFLHQQATGEARAARPEIFGRLDKTTAKLDSVDAEIRRIQERLDGGSDYQAVAAVDPETAARLQEIDAELAGEIPTRRRRDLEQEREMVAASTNDLLPPANRTAIDDTVAAPLRDQLAKLQAERAGLDAFRQQHADRASRVIQDRLDVAATKAKMSLFVPPEPARPADVGAAERRVDAAMQAEQVSAAPKEGPSKTAREIAEDFKVDPTTGDFPEMIDFDRLVAAGRLAPEELKAFEEATAMLERTKSYSDGLRAAAVCMMV